MDGNLYCKFERSTQLMSYLLLARGLASRDGISYHGTEKTVSPRPLKPGNNIAISIRKKMCVL